MSRRQQPETPEAKQARHETRERNEALADELERALGIDTSADVATVWLDPSRDALMVPTRYARQIIEALAWRKEQTKA